jgi:cytochrome oxidase assembly protein ShyY1
MEGLQRLAPLLMLVLAIAGVVVAVALWRLAGETSERACIEAAEAKYPAAPVSAFVTRDRSATGPLKLSFVRERTRAVDACD